MNECNNKNGINGPASFPLPPSRRVARWEEFKHLVELVSLVGGLVFCKRHL